jgi:formate-dependent nitrite reductase membrane component NrfD
MVVDSNPRTRAETLSRTGEADASGSRPEAREGIAARLPADGRAPPLAATLSRHAGEGRSNHQQEAIPTYYEQPALKPSLYGYKVSAYILVGGMAGSAQIIATIADLADRDGCAGVIRNGRYLALAGSVVGAGLLIIDLHTPQRFYNMLRIFRPTSPMSIGTYVLTSFGGLSALLAAAQLRRELGAGPGALDRVARAAQIPAAVTGAAMSTYTGALLAATSTPLWAALPRLLPAVFGASAMASAAAALSLPARGAERERLHRLELVASAVELVLLAMLPVTLRGKGIATRIGVVPVLAAAAAPLLHQIAGAVERPRADRAGDAAAEARRAKRFGTASAAAVLAGAFLLRHLVLRAGNESAKRPRDQFRFSQPR